MGIEELISRTAVPLSPFTYDQSPVDRALFLTGAPLEHSLGFGIQQQKMENWCWAATAFSVARHFKPNTGWTQCRVAAEVLHRSCCAFPGECDQPAALDDALTAVGRFGGRTNAPFSLAQVRNEVGGEERVVCARIKWAGIGAHFVVIEGYSITDETLSVQDPADPRFSGIVGYVKFRDNYRDSGRWTHSYRT